MKILKILVTTLILAIAAVFIFNQFTREESQEDVVESSGEVLGVPTPNGVEIKINERNFEAQFVVAENAADIFLLPNFEEKLTSKVLQEQSECSILVSGGYYAAEGYPTGLFISESKQLKRRVVSSLSNAVYSINDFETSRITRLTPQDPLRVALQNGPMLIENDGVLKLALKRDEEARRVVVGVTGKNETVFIVIYDPHSVFLGPKLEELPEALGLFEKNSLIDLADAMNLDGGTASSFISKDVSLRELSPIGSYFCIK